MSKEKTEKNGIRAGDEHCNAMKLTKNGVVFLNVKGASKEHIRRLISSATELLNLWDISGEESTTIWEDHHPLINDKGQRDLVLRFKKEAKIDKDKIEQLKGVFVCMEIEDYRKKYCCKPQCSETIT